MTASIPTLSTSLDDLPCPGVMVAVTPTEAEDIGLCLEDAVSEADAWAANSDAIEVAHGA